MFDAVYSWILTCLQFALDVFVTILDKTGTGSFYLSGMFLIAIFGFILSPLIKRSFAGAGSDSARKKRIEFESNSDS